MSNRSDDITVRIRAEYDKALADLQRFIGTAEKGFAELPKVVQQLNTSVDALTQKIGEMGRSDGPDQVTRKLRRTNEEATQLKKTFDALVTGGKAIGAAMAGWQAGKMVFQGPMEHMLDYDTKLAHLANVAFSDRSVAGRIAGKGELNSVILGAVRTGGGTRESALDAFQKIVGSGAVSDKDAIALLPSVVRGATASGAAPDQIADIAIRSMQNFGFKADELPKVIDMAIKSGNLGGFELKDMAKWLPSQMAQAATLGMKGEKGLSQLLALNQVAMTTAGTTDEAGNNVRNLLNKLNSSDTQNDFKKLGINLTGSLQNAAGKGIDPITAFGQLLDRVMASDKSYQALTKKRATAGTDAEKTAIIEQQLKLAEGSAIGKVVQDQQARSALLAVLKQGDTFRSQVGQVTFDSSKGTTAGNMAVLEGSPGFKRQQALNEQINDQFEALKKLNPALESYWEATTKLSREHPVLAAAMEGGKVGVNTLAAGAGAASVVMMLLTKNATAASAALGGVAVGGGAVNGGPFGSHMGKFGKLMNLTGAGMLGWEIGTNIVNPLVNKGVRWATGDDKQTLGGLIYDLTHKNAAGTAQQRQMADGGGSPEAMQRAVQNAFRGEDKKVQIGLTLGYDETMRPVVKQYRFDGKGAELATGPMMTH